MVVDKSTLDHCLEGITFPADSDTIVECAEGNLCSRDVLLRIGDLPPQTFISEDSLLCSLGNARHC